jgi:hypothetical protein
MSTARLIVAAALVAANLGCGDAPLTAPAGSTVFLLANPPFVVANGGVSVVTAVVTEPAGTFVPDGTEVFFFTDLGRIEASRQTKDGVARVNFVADSRSGNANVTAVSGGPPQAGGGEGGSSSGTGSASVTIAIGSALPTRVLVTANPNSVTISTPSRIVANVFDENGNAVKNVPVVFTLSGGSGAEVLDSGGGQTFTDTNGQAFDTLRTGAGSGVSRTVTVTATTSNGTTDSVSVGVNQSPTPPAAEWAGSFGGR